MTEMALLPSDDRTYGMERTSESEELVETECDGNETLKELDQTSWMGEKENFDKRIISLKRSHHSCTHTHTLYIYKYLTKLEFTEQKKYH